MVSSSTKMLVGAGLAGLAAGILFAPKSGKETRAEMKKKAHEMSDKATQKMEEGRAKVADLKHEAVEQANKVRSAIRKKESAESGAGSSKLDEPLIST